MSTPHTPAPSDAALLARFRPVFDRIAEGAAGREARRELVHAPVAWLREAGFGALRVPQAFGGAGASVEQLFDLLVELAAADSNLPQSLRAHFGFIERAHAELPPERRAPWFDLAAGGAIFGNGNTERGDAAVGTLHTTLTPLSPVGQGSDTATEKQWRLDGEKFYSTGTLYADWIAVTARRTDAEAGDRVVAMVRADAAGVDRSDDWRGFGQRLTASGTTRFAAVAVPDSLVFAFPRDRASTTTAVFQLFHIATLAGIAQAIVRDATHYVQQRTRIYSHGSGTAARHDPLVQQVLGQLVSTAFATRAAARDVARGLGDIDRLRQGGHDVPAALIDDVEQRAAKAQVAVIEQVLAAAGKLFDVGGASALDEDLRLDRHWRNARALASHNPWIYKARALGDQVLNDARPTFFWSVGTSAS